MSKEHVVHSLNRAETFAPNSEEDCRVSPEKHLEPLRIRSQQRSLLAIRMLAFKELIAHAIDY
ncbi:hypothetical protein KXV85_007713 [Aspergillus fumigatus]|nr:hypothetical protein KXX06_009254 [Aspergillus fumigatus]KAH2830205.1 hypothetical protein KXV85_007713 [Aspergillus fumigatus]